jgi:CRP/FNR family cyclic AMP-dependent transcriptional regulator
MDASAFFRYPNATAARADTAMTLLRNATAEDWRRLLAHTTVRRFVAGEWLITEGTSDTALYFLGDGELEVLMPRARTGGPRRLAVVRAGSVVGEQSFLDSLPRSTSIRACSDGEAFRLSRENFLVFSAREAVVARDLLLDLGRVVSLRLRETTRFLALGH